MPKRYDPDGNEKRRAKTGERQCVECARRQKMLGKFYCFWALIEDEREALCRADDYAGDCRHFKGMK